MDQYTLFFFASLTVVVLGQDCNFDNNGTTRQQICGWENRISSREGYRWIYNIGPTPQFRTGPQQDRSGEGGYIYAPGGRGERDGSFTTWSRNNRAHFNSPVIHTRWVPKLMRFYYLMFGRSVGILNIFVAVKGRSRPAKPQWRKTGDNGDFWTLGEVVIPSNSTARIIFEAVPGKSPQGDIAVDEITFQELCIDCDFEGETTPPSCQFEQSTDDDFNWMLNSGKTPTRKTGPNVDHTKGTSKGVYMYIESTSSTEGQSAILISPRYQKEIGECQLSFFYHMHGEHIGQLNVHVISQPGVLGNPLWTRDGEQGTKWFEALVNLTDISGPFKIAFNGTRGDGAAGDIAIDDIKLLGIACLNRDVLPALERGDTYWDYCDSDPCANNATCITRAGRYECVCSNAWTGPTCETEVPDGPCRDNPCLNGGSCYQEMNVTVGNSTSSNFTCECVEGFNGDICEIDLNAPFCDSQPCLNGGICTIAVDGYECKCPPNWNGTNCEIDVDECLTDICKNGGNCTNQPGGFNCSCPFDWHGRTCEEECVDNNQHCSFWAGVGECKVNPKYMLVYCKQSCGVCGDYVCEDKDERCPVWAEVGECGKNPFYMLAKCHLSCQVCIDDECRSSPCMNFGTCIDGEDSYTCECQEGFTGVVCENNTNECASDPCQNNGTCIDGVNSYTCNCTDMYDGTHCEHRKDHCSSEPCLNGGNCTSNESGFTCTCLAGFEGETCDRDIDECASSPCENDGVCIDKVNGFLCNCTEAWVGVICDMDFDECKSNPCQNGGLCYHGIGESLFFCDCVAGWTGDDCSTDINECETNPCKNGATCTDSLNGFTCTCTEGWAGIYCDADVLECASDPCLNGGECVDNVGSFSCICLEGYEGDKCQYDINECHSQPCLNGGTCEDLPNGHLCRCPTGFTGRYCETVYTTPPRTTTPRTTQWIIDSYFYHSEKWDYSYEQSFVPSDEFPSGTTTPPFTTTSMPATTMATTQATTQPTTITQSTTSTTTSTTQQPVTSTATTPSPSTTTTTTQPTTTRTTTRTTTTIRPTTQQPRRTTTNRPTTLEGTTRENVQTTTLTSTLKLKSTTTSKGNANENTITSGNDSDKSTTDNNEKNNSRQSTKEKASDIMLPLSIIVVATVVLIVLIIVVIVAYSRYRKSRTRVYEQFDMDSKEDGNFGREMADVEPDSYSNPVDSNSFNYSPM